MDGEGTAISGADMRILLVSLISLLYILAFCEITVHDGIIHYFSKISDENSIKITLKQFFGCRHVLFFLNIKNQIHFIILEVLSRTT